VTDRIEKTELNENLLDTGEAAREALRMIRDVLNREDRILNEQKRFCEKWDAAHKEHETFMIVAKRSVKQFLKGIGWLD
jgi:hypothetical protein